MNRTMLLVTGTGMAVAATLIAGPVQAMTEHSTPVTPVPTAMVTTGVPAHRHAGHASPPLSGSPSVSGSPMSTPTAVSTPVPARTDEVVTEIQVGPFWPGPVD